MNSISEERRLIRLERAYRSAGRLKRRERQLAFLDVASKRRKLKEQGALAALEAEVANLRRLVYGLIGELKTLTSHSHAARAPGRQRKPAAPQPKATSEPPWEPASQ